MVLNLCKFRSTQRIPITSTCLYDYHAPSRDKDNLIGIGSVIGNRIGSEIGEAKKLRFNRIGDRGIKFFSDRIGDRIGNFFVIGTTLLILRITHGFL